MNLADRTPRSQSTNRPWQSRTEFLVDQALQTNFAADDALRAMASPGHGRGDLFPARTGFRRTEATIGDVLNIDRYVATNRSWVSGFPIEYQGGHRVYNNGDDQQNSGSTYSQGALWT